MKLGGNSGSFSSSPISNMLKVGVGACRIRYPQVPWRHPARVWHDPYRPDARPCGP